MERLLPFEAYYENSAGVRLCLSEAPRLLLGGELFDSSWKLGTATRPLSEGGRLILRKRPCSVRSAELLITASSAQELAALLIELSSVLDYDIQNESAGKLWINGLYLLCWCSASKKELSCDFQSTARVKLSITPKYPAWHKEKLYRFAPSSGDSSDGHDYPYSYPFRYGSGMRRLVIENSGISPAPMKLIFYGAAENPKLYLSTVPVGINLQLAAGEYAVIDQLERSVYSVSQSGIRTNRFDDRLKNGSCFEYAPVGSSVVEISGSSGVDVILIEQRSEPPWALS